MFVRFSLLALASGGLIVSAAAADPLREAAEKAAACRTITADADRLTCLDAAALALSSALGTSAVIADAPAVPDEPRWAQAPKVKAPKTPEPAPVVATTSPSEPAKAKEPPLWARVFNPDKEQGEDEAVRVQVTRVVENNVGRHFFVMADGQEWRQTVVGKVREPKDLPAAATIVRESYGSPQLSFDSRPGKKYRVRRVK